MIADLLLSGPQEEGKPRRDSNSKIRVRRLSKIWATSV